MTLEERADKWYKAIMHCNICDIKYMVKLALMEQDRETRRACIAAIESSQACDIDEDGGWQMMSKGDVISEIRKA